MLKKKTQQLNKTINKHQKKKKNEKAQLEELIIIIRKLKKSFYMSLYKKSKAKTFIIIKIKERFNRLKFLKY